jgi:hypothetical protein
MISKAQRRDGIFKYCDVVADLSEMVFKAGKSSAESWIQSKCVSRPFPKTVRDAIAAWISSADSSLSRVDYGDRWRMLRALSAFEERML